MIKIEIYTLGHSNYPFDKFIEILKKYNINCVVDIRAIPYSKYNTQYNKEFFQSNLKKLGYTYIYMADEFGAKRKTRISYNDEGYADFDKVILEDDFKRGIERIKFLFSIVENKSGNFSTEFVTKAVEEIEETMYPKEEKKDE